METKAKFLETIKQYKDYDTEIIGKAYDKAKLLHEGQLRKSGEPYLIHPVAVAVILAQLGMDDETLVGGLLHDVVEDTSYTREMLVEDFGEEVALLVDGVTKLGTLKFDSKEVAQAETLRKMFLAMSKDIRVLIIKLADRLHNMRTLGYMRPEKIIEKSRETLDIYAPLASRLGIFTIKFELEDIALKYLHRKEYDELQKEVAEKKTQRELFINEVMQEIREALEAMNMHFDISGRSKHLYSVYKKMVIQHKQLDEIFDLTAVRVIVENVRDCYAVLGQVHTMWKPIPGRFKDYIAMPKPNMYQSLHTTVLGDNGEPFEIQIRTYEMHIVAQRGPQDADRGLCDRPETSLGHDEGGLAPQLGPDVLRGTRAHPGRAQGRHESVHPGARPAAPLPQVHGARAAHGLDAAALHHPGVDPGDTGQDPLPAHGPGHEPGGLQPVLGGDDGGARPGEGPQRRGEPGDGPHLRGQKPSKPPTTSNVVGGFFVGVKY